MKTGRIYNAADLGDMDEAIEHIFRTNCLDANNVQIIRLTGVGISLGAAMLGNFAALKGTSNHLDAQFGLSCHYECSKAFAYLENKLFGSVDYMLATGMHLSLGKTFKEFDVLVEKIHPERMVAPLVNKARSLTKDFSYVAATSGGFTVEEYIFRSDVTPRMH